MIPKSFIAPALCLLALFTPALARDLQPPLMLAKPLLAAQLPVDLNVHFRQLADLQPSKPGTMAWVNGGMLPYANNVGGHPAYGWRCPWKLTQTRTQDIIANYAHRASYYDFAPNRMSGQDSAGRPFGYVPTKMGDLPDGRWIHPNGVTISGMDPEHFAIEPLVKVSDSSGIIVSTPNGPKDARLVAREMLRLLYRAQFGVLRKSTGEMVTYIFHDRAQTYFLRSAVEGGQRGLIAKEDMALFLTYFKTRVLPKWEYIPNDGRVYNGLNWALPSLYDFWKVCPDPLLKDRIWKVLVAMSKLELQLCQVVPGKACQVEEVYAWGPGLTPASISSEYYYGAWGVRSMLVAAKVLDSDVCYQEAMGEAAFWLAQPLGQWKLDWLSWLVDADGLPLFGLQ